jgi:coenzyme F420-reducing hydrogenase delta subunit
VDVETELNLYIDPVIKQNPDTQHDPKIVGFVCNWGGYTGVEMAGIEKREYNAGLRLVRFQCLGRLNLGILLKAFELGADGVLLLGCPPHECHYCNGAQQAVDLVQETRKLLSLLGTDPARLEFVEVPLGGSEVFVNKIDAFVSYLKQSQPAALAASRPVAEMIKENSSC